MGRTADHPDIQGANGCTSPHGAATPPGRPSQVIEGAGPTSAVGRQQTALTPSLNAPPRKMTVGLGRAARTADMHRATQGVVGHRWAPGGRHVGRRWAPSCAISVPWPKTPKGPRRSKTPSELALPEWRGQDLNLRPSGYERADRRLRLVGRMGVCPGRAGFSASGGSCRSCPWEAVCGRRAYKLLTSAGRPSHCVAGESASVSQVHGKARGHRRRRAPQPARRVAECARRQSPAGWWEIECDARCVQLASAG